MRTLLQDFRYAVRSLSRSPGFSIAVVATLALGIGANTAVYSLVRGVLFRALPFPAPERLVAVSESYPAKGYPLMVASPPNYLDWKAQSKSFAVMGAYNTADLALSEGREPERLRGTTVTAGFFEALGVAPASGRVFAPGEFSTSNDHVAVLSHGVWRRRFGSDPALVGKTIRLEGEPYLVVGVMPANFRFPEAGPDAWVPLTFPENVATQRGAHYLDVVARLAPGTTREQASAEMHAIAGTLERQYHDTNEGHSAVVTPLREMLVRSVRPALLTLLGAVAFVTLIACANVANLMLIRASHRGAELAIRTALGAGRWRIARQLLTETFVLAACGAGLGIFLAEIAVEAIVRWSPGDIPRLAEVGVDGGVLAFTAIWTVAAVILCGLAPVAGVFARAPMAALKVAGADSGAQPGPARLRRLLVVGELGLALLLLVGAGLLVRSLARLAAVDPGFSADRVLRFDLSLPSARYPDDERIGDLTDRVLGAVRALPGVQSAGATFGLPLTDFRFSSSFRVEGRPEDPAHEASAQLRIASRDYFQTVRLPLLAGRSFMPQDVRGAPVVILASQAAAAKFFPAGDAIGQRLRFGARPGNKRIQGEIIGIVGDVHDEGLANGNTPEFYASLDQSPVGFFTVVLRTTQEPGTLAAAVRGAIQTIDPELPVTQLEPMAEVVSRSIAGPRFTMSLLLVFAATALLLSAVGIYGVTAYAVSQRTRELGIRMALGADGRSVRGLVLRDGLRLAGAGLGLGLIAAFALTRLLRGLLYEVPPTDLVTHAGVALILLGVVLAACWIPARRAARLDPWRALRAE
ncbi:MAG TPA: ABC transporter permease [Thermoanaerobaculia bacterium]